MDPFCFFQGFKGDCLRKASDDDDVTLLSTTFPETALVLAPCDMRRAGTMFSRSFGDDGEVFVTIGISATTAIVTAGTCGVPLLLLLVISLLVLNVLLSVWPPADGGCGRIGVTFTRIIDMQAKLTIVMNITTLRPPNMHFCLICLR